LTYLDLGISSRDLLNTTSIDLGYRYYADEKTGSWRANVSYQAFYPILDVEFTSGKRNTTSAVLQRDVNFKWNENGVATGLRVPLLLTRSKYRTNIEVGNSVGITQVTDFTNKVTENEVVVSTGTGRIVPANDTLYYVFTDKVSNGYLYSNRFFLTFSNLLKQSRRDFNPKFGQSFAFENYSTPFGGNFKGNLMVARGLFFFPGLFKHHSLFFRGGYQARLVSDDFDVYTFRNRLVKPRGYSYPADTKFAALSGNYQFPVWYPDISIGPLLNIQRIKANLFTDYGEGQGKSYLYEKSNPVPVAYFDSKARYLSYGMEMTFDVNILRFLPQFELGVRASYLTANKFANQGLVFEFLIGNIPL